jgi:hypothetical protein
MDRESPSRLERSLLLHLLEHRGAQVRFEADQWTTEFGIARAFAQEDPNDVKGTLHHLETERYIYRRVQYVIGYSEPKLVFSLTPIGYHAAARFHRSETDGASAAEPSAPSDPAPAPPENGDGGHRTPPPTERSDRPA